MTIALYMDENVSGAITNGLRQRGVDVITAKEDGHDQTPDPLVLDRANELDRVLFTQDEDLLAEAAHRQRNNLPFSGVVYAHQMWVSIGQCISDLELVAKAGEPADLANKVLFIPF